MINEQRVLLKTVSSDCNSSVLLPNGVTARFGEGLVNDMAISPDGNYIAVASDIGLWLYEISTESSYTLWDTRQHTILSAVTFSPSGEWVLTGYPDGTVHVWNVVNGKCLAELKTEERIWEHGLHTLVFSPDGQKLAVSGGWNHYSVDVWEVKPESLPNRLHFKHILTVNSAPGKTTSTSRHVGPVAFSSDGSLLACASPNDSAKGLPYIDDIISLWEVETGKHITSLTGLTDSAYSICFSPCGRYLVATDRQGKTQIWEVMTWQLWQTYLEDGSPYQIASYSSKGILRVAAFSDGDDVLKIWEPEKGNVFTTPQEGRSWYRPYFLSGTHLAFSDELEIKVWDVEKEHIYIISQAHVTPPKSILFSPDMKTIVTLLPSNGVCIWNAVMPQQPPRLFRPIGRKAKSNCWETYLSVEMSYSGKSYATSADDTYVKLWQVGNNTPLAVFRTFAEPQCAAFSPITNLLACRDKAAQIYIWDVQSSQLCHTFKGKYPDALGFSFQKIAFSLNGEYFVSNRDLLYDFVNEKMVTQFPVEDDDFYFHMFSQDSTLVVGETEEEILLWNIQECEYIFSIPKPKAWMYSDIEALTLSPCGRYLAASCPESNLDSSTQRQSIHLWSVRKGDLLVILEVDFPILALSFSPDSKVLASGMDDGTILLWDLNPYLKNT